MQFLRFIKKTKMKAVCFKKIFQSFAFFVVFSLYKIRVIKYSMCREKWERGIVMKVTLRDIRRLQEDVADKIDDLSIQPDADFDKLAELRTLNFNLSMIFLRYSMEKDSTEIEIGGTDSENAIVDALKSKHVKEVHRKVGSNSSSVCVDNLAQMAMDLVQQIDVIVSGIKPGRNAVLMNNINRKFSFASELLNEVASLKDNPEKLSLWKSEEVSNAVTAASMMGRTKSEKKSAAARLNGKKGGRPRKNPLPQTAKVEPAMKKVSAGSAVKKTATKKTYAAAERRMVPPARKIAK